MRWYYSNSIKGFLEDSEEQILGQLTAASEFDVDQEQKAAWIEQINILKEHIANFDGRLFFEFNIPRMGKRVDLIIIIDGVVFVVEFKVGEKSYNQSAEDQVLDYAVDLKNFHSTSHKVTILPVLVATNAKHNYFSLKQSIHNDGVLQPVRINADQLREVLEATLASFQEHEIAEWEKGTYKPTPTIIEAALALYAGHNVEEIVRRDADATNLATTVNTLQSIIQRSFEAKNKAICFVTGVPGAGKTLVGLDVAVKNIDKKSDHYSVYLSGNGPLVNVLQEALAMDQVERAKERNQKIKKGYARSKVKLFIQNVHHFRDDCLALGDTPPLEHVVIFDESQRAWNVEMTSDFMRRKKKSPEFQMSEPEYLISCMNRHKDWAVIICLVGGGQEINRGEAGIAEWIRSVKRSFPKWLVYCSEQLIGDGYIHEDEYGQFKTTLAIHESKNLHLATSMRSFRASQMSEMVNALLALDLERTISLYKVIKDRYPIVITRDLAKGREWLKNMARGRERYGIVVSSKAYRLKPHAIDVRIKTDPIHWFLGKKDDVRSSYYLEDVATEFQIQGLELDWVCVTWDADLRIGSGKLSHFNFVGNKWQRVNKEENQKYLENAYRVLMTRARQGMVLVVPEGSPTDVTRSSSYYDPTYDYLRKVGFPEIH